MTANEKTVEAVAEAFETFDRRLSSIESDMADAAAFGDESAKSLAKLQELYVSMDNKIDELKGMLGNYVEATTKLRQTTASLHSEVREKLKAVGG